MMDFFFLKLDVFLNFYFIFKLFVLEIKVVLNLLVIIMEEVVLVSVSDVVFLVLEEIKEKNKVGDIKIVVEKIVIDKKWEWRKKKY